MIQRLSPSETRQAIRRLGINQPAPVASFGIFDPAKGVRYSFHRHVRHQFLFPTAGVLFVETERAMFSCSAQLGVWIPARTPHATTSGTGPAVSLYFRAGSDTPPSLAAEKAPCFVRLTPLLREAAAHVIKQSDVAQTHGYADALFRVVLGLIASGITRDCGPQLPVSQSQPIQRAIAVILERLATIRVRDAAQQSGQSERTLRRRFARELGIGPELFIQRARLIRGMQLLLMRSHSGPRSITEIALEVGYSNHSAFTSAFRALTGQTPTEFRRRELCRVED